MHSLSLNNPKEADFFWRQLGKFRNVENTTKLLIKQHNIPNNQKNNAKKQAAQIGYCIKLAKEYFTASRHVSIATKAVLQYYGIMNLAIAEFLFKQDGKSSLDRAREKHSHHGLEFSFDQSSLKQLSFKGLATGLKSKPYIHSNERRGTFNLWNKTSKGYPCVGKIREISSSFQVTKNNILAAETSFFKPVNQAGLNIYEVFMSLPFLNSTFAHFDHKKNYVRGMMEQEINELSNSNKFTLVIHPDLQLDELLKQFLISPSEVPHVSIKKEKDGALINYTTQIGFPVGNLRFPSSIQYDTDELFWYVKDHQLNEFGYIYIGLYMLGNFARYYPDHWVRTVEEVSDLAIVCEHFMENLEMRATLLIYSELSSCLCLH